MAHPCATPLVCSPATQTCEKTATNADASVIDDAPIDVFVPPDAPMGPANDLPTNPTVITSAGTIMEDLANAHDDAGPTAVGNGCGATGGLDVFFEVDLAADEVWYFDTFGSNFPTVIRTYPGACTGGAAPNGATCNTGACGTNHAQLATQLGSGKNCIVIDQDGLSANTMLDLHVERAGRSGTRLATGTNTVAGTTCGFTNKTTGSCGGAGFDRMYFAVGCPAATKMLTASTCDVATTYDTVLYVRGNNSNELACNDNDAACTATTTGGSTVTSVALTSNHLFQLIIDGAASAGCGPYSLTTTLQ